MGLKNPALIAVLILVIIVLFGSSKLPDVARAVGQSLKILKKDVKDLRDDGSKTEEAQGQPPAATAPATETASSGVTPAAPSGQSATTPVPHAEPQQGPNTPATPDVVEGDDSKS